MPRIFKDEVTQALFDRDGYVVIDFITADQAALIATKFYELHNDLPKGFYSDTFNMDDGFKQEIYAHTEKVFENSVTSNFSDFRKLGSTFLCKSPGEEGKVGVHQDWTIVDESKYYSATIWVPTVYTTEQNGAMRVLPGSHRFFDTVRSPNVDFCYRDTEQQIWDSMITIPMKAGQAFILNHAVIHGSAPNRTGKERLAIAYGLIPKEAKLVYYHKNDKDRLEKYEMPDEFFRRYYNIGERPSFGDMVEEIDYNINQVSAIKVAALINQEKRKRKMQPLFKDTTVQKNFDRDGYVKVPALDRDDVDQLLAYHESVRFKDDAGFGFHISMDQKDKGLVKNILDKLFEVAVPKLQPHFLHAKPFVGSFVIKESNPTGIVPVHQDWSFVEDEDSHCSVTCWIPLVDVNTENGAMGVIKGSHNYFKNLRPSPAPQSPSPISEHMFAIFPYLHLIEMKAGEALIFDNRTFHGSPPNTSDKPRIAFGIGFTHEDANLVHYYLKPDDKKDTVLKYKIDKDFFLKYENSKLSKMYDNKEMIEGYDIISELPYVLPTFSADELTDLIKSTGNEFNVPMCEKLAKLFNYNMNGSPKAKREEPAVAPIQTPTIEPVIEVEITKPWVWIDDRTFIEKYTPMNIMREVKKRLFEKSEA
jgi:ectoine hydroxylase-related dioxygenase (phytanoyl-CoA dioxygenase family)